MKIKMSSILSFPAAHSSTLDPDKIKPALENPAEKALINMNIRLRWPDISGLA